MSRIDEALARAGSRPAEPASPIVPPADVDGAFAQEPDVMPAAGPADVRRPEVYEPEVHEPEPTRSTLPPDLPLVAAAGAPDAPDAVDEDQRHKPLSEKLSINSGDPTSTEQYRRVAGR